MSGVKRGIASSARAAIMAAAGVVMVTISRAGCALDGTTEAVGMDDMLKVNSVGGDARCRDAMRRTGEYLTPVTPSRR